MPCAGGSQLFPASIKMVELFRNQRLQVAGLVIVCINGYVIIMTCERLSERDVESLVCIFAFYTAWTGMQ